MPGSSRWLQGVPVRFDLPMGSARRQSWRIIGPSGPRSRFLIATIVVFDIEEIPRPRLRLTLPRAVFAALFALALAVPIVDAAVAIFDFCLGQCGPAIFPTPQDPDGSCDGACATFLCGCNETTLVDGNNKQIGLACDCIPHPAIF